jgi:hypothetical protein
MQLILCHPWLPVVYLGHSPHWRFSISRDDVRSNVRARFGLANHVRRSFTCDDIFGPEQHFRSVNIYFSFHRFRVLTSHGYQGTTLLHREISGRLQRQGFSISISPISQRAHSIPSVVSMKALPVLSFSASPYRHLILVWIESVR